MEKGGWLYIITNRPNGTLYIGVTADLARRVWEHREGNASQFTRRYGLRQLVYAERHDDIRAAIQRENSQGPATSLEGAADRQPEPRLD